MKAFFVLAIAAVAILLFGCVGTSQSSPQPATPAGVPAHLTNCGYSGSWNTDWGAMQLSQAGSEVSGNYTHDSGRISGTVSDGVFVGKWSESPTYSEPNDAGDAEFYFATDCSSFTGKWRYGTGSAGAAWDGTWFGSKSS